MIKLSFLNLFRRKTRTLLSLSGIAIGVAAIIVLVSLVDGFTAQFDEVIGGYKAITVYEKGASDIVFSKIDDTYAGKIESFPDVKAAIPEIWFVPEKVDSENIGLNTLTPPTVYGLDYAKYHATNASGWVGDIEKGAPLSSNSSGEILIGVDIADSFDKFVGSPMKINGKNFRVKGILEGESDFVANVIVMNLDDAREASGFMNGKITSLTVTLHDFSKDQKVADLIALKYGEELQAYTQAELTEQFTGIIGNLRLLAIAVAIISSIVAGIGIANTMLMSVLERFKEIGALKAVGWANKDVMKMVVYESMFLGVLGGVVGIALAYAVDASLMGFFGVSYKISFWLLLSSFLFAVMLGIISGLYPAYRASLLDPVEALRA